MLGLLGYLNDREGALNTSSSARKIEIKRKMIIYAEWKRIGLRNLIIIFIILKHVFAMHFTSHFPIIGDANPRVFERLDRSLVAMCRLV